NGNCVAVGAMCGPNNSGMCPMNGPCVIPCGGPGQSCCAGNRCDNGGCCVPPMAGLLCSASGTNCLMSMCMNGSCGGGTCGGLNQGCCNGINGTFYCSAPNAVCVGGGGMNRTCMSCGMMGMRCCANNSCSQGTCMNGMCM